MWWAYCLHHAGFMWMQHVQHVLTAFWLSLSLHACLLGSQMHARMFWKWKWSHRSRNMLCISWSTHMPFEESLQAMCIAFYSLKPLLIYLCHWKFNVNLLFLGLFHSSFNGSHFPACFGQPLLSFHYRCETPMRSLAEFGFKIDRVTKSFTQVWKLPTVDRQLPNCHRKWMGASVKVFLSI